MSHSPERHGPANATESNSTNETDVIQSHLEKKKLLYLLDMVPDADTLTWHRNKDPGIGGNDRSAPYKLLLFKQVEDGVTKKKVHAYIVLYDNKAPVVLFTQFLRDEEGDVERYIIEGSEVSELEMDYPFSVFQGTQSPYETYKLRALIKYCFLMGDHISAPDLHRHGSDTFMRMLVDALRKMYKEKNIRAARSNTIGESDASSKDEGVTNGLQAGSPQVMRSIEEAIVPTVFLHPGGYPRFSGGTTNSEPPPPRSKTSAHTAFRCEFAPSLGPINEGLSLQFARHSLSSQPEDARHHVYSRASTVTHAREILRTVQEVGSPVSNDLTIEKPTSTPLSMSLNVNGKRQIDVDDQRFQKLLRLRNEGSAIDDVLKKMDRETRRLHKSKKNRVEEFNQQWDRLKGWDLVEVAKMLSKMEEGEVEET